MIICVMGGGGGEGDPHFWSYNRRTKGTSFILFSAFPNQVDFIWFIQIPKEDFCRVLRNPILQEAQQQKVSTILQTQDRVLGH